MPVSAQLGEGWFGVERGLSSEDGVEFNDKRNKRAGCHQQNWNMISKGKTVFQRVSIFVQLHF